MIFGARSHCSLAGRAVPPRRYVFKGCRSADASPLSAVRASSHPSAAAPHTVHILKEPEGQPSCDVLFFHGLQLGSYENAWLDTWKNAEGVLWPKDWLGLDFPTARIFSICYDSQAIRGSKDMDEISQELVHEVCFLAKVGQDRPVVLVGHSLGGLVLKKLATEAHKEAGLPGSILNKCCTAFCNNLAGTFFYATPHGGAKLGSLASYVFGGLGQKGPVLDYLTVFSTHSAQLNRDFRLAFPTLCFMALVETTEYRVVQPGAAMQGMHNYVEVKKHHINICRPLSRDDNTYRYFREYITQALDSFKARQTKRDEVLQQAPQLSVDTQLKLSDKESALTTRYTRDVAPAMAWVKKQKEQLEQVLGEEWALGLYPPELGSRELEVTAYRRVMRDFWWDVQGLYSRGVLDDNFFRTNNMARRARDYRMLVEPVEIANFYHGNMHLPNSRGEGGHYIDGIEVELTDNNDRRPGRFILLQQVEQRVFGARQGASTYTTQSSLGLARLLKERVGSRTWRQYMQSDGEAQDQQGGEHA